MISTSLNRKAGVLFVLFLFIDFALVSVFYSDTMGRKILEIETSALQSAVQIQYTMELHHSEKNLNLISSNLFERHANEVALINEQGHIISSNKLVLIGQKAERFFEKDKVFNDIKVSNPKFIKLKNKEAGYIIPLKSQSEIFYLMIDFDLKNIKRNLSILSTKYFIFLAGLQFVALILFLMWVDVSFLDPLMQLVQWKEPILESVKSNDLLFSRNDEIGQLGVRLYRNAKNFDEVSKKLKLVENSLNQNQKLSLIGQMTASVAHEIKNPLAFITMIVGSNIAENNKNPLNIEELIKIKEACDRANLTLQELLSFSRQSDSEKKVDIHQLLQNLVVVNGIFLKQRNHVFQTELVATSYQVLASPTKLQQIFTNLISNASDAVSPGQRGLIELRSFNSDQYIILSVTDNGSGIDEKDQTKIFKNFFTTKDSGHGTGLGMGIVNNLVSELNGSIWFETEVGKGSTFYVKFPLA